MVVVIGGIWCLNCQDEVCFLGLYVVVYKKDGLEVISFNFEYVGDCVVIFVKMDSFVWWYNLGFLMLLVGELMFESVKVVLVVIGGVKVYLFVFFIGCDGCLCEIYVGWVGFVIGVLNVKVEEEFDVMVKCLLSELV